MSSCGCKAKSKCSCQVKSCKCGSSINRRHDLDSDVSILRMKLEIAHIKLMLSN